MVGTEENLDVECADTKLKCPIDWLDELNVDRRVYSSFQFFLPQRQWMVRDVYLRNDKKDLRGILLAFQEVAGSKGDLFLFLTSLPPPILNDESIKVLIKHRDMYPELLGPDLLGVIAKMTTEEQLKILETCIKEDDRFFTRASMNKILRQILDDFTPLEIEPLYPYFGTHLIPYAQRLLQANPKILYRLMEEEGSASWFELCRNLNGEMMKSFLESLRDLGEKCNELWDNLLHILHQARVISFSTTGSCVLTLTDIEQSINSSLSLMGIPSLQKRQTRKSKSFSFLETVGNEIRINLSHQNLADEHLVQLLSRKFKSSLWEMPGDNIVMDLSHNNLTQQSMEQIYRFFRMTPPLEEKRLNQLLLGGNSIGDPYDYGSKWIAALLYNQKYPVHELNLTKTNINSAGLATIMLSISQHPHNIYPFNATSETEEKVSCKVKVAENPINLKSLLDDYKNGALANAKMDTVRVSVNGEMEENVDKENCQLDIEMTPSTDTESYDADSWPSGRRFIEGLFLDGILKIARLEEQRHIQEEKSRIRAAERLRWSSPPPLKHHLQQIERRPRSRLPGRNFQEFEGLMKNTSENCIDWETWWWGQPSVARRVVSISTRKANPDQSELMEPEANGPLGADDGIISFKKKRGSNKISDEKEQSKKESSIREELWERGHLLRQQNIKDGQTIIVNTECYLSNTNRLENSKNIKDGKTINCSINHLTNGSINGSINHLTNGSIDGQTVNNYSSNTNGSINKLENYHLSSSISNFLIPDPIYHKTHENYPPIPSRNDLIPDEDKGRYDVKGHGFQPIVRSNFLSEENSPYNYYSNGVADDEYNNSFSNGPHPNGKNYDNSIHKGKCFLYPDGLNHDYPMKGAPPRYPLSHQRDGQESGYPMKGSHPPHPAHDGPEVGHPMKGMNPGYPSRDEYGVKGSHAPYAQRDNNDVPYSSKGSLPGYSIKGAYGGYPPHREMPNPHYPPMKGMPSGYSPPSHLDGPDGHPNYSNKGALPNSLHQQMSKSHGKGYSTDETEQPPSAPYYENGKGQSLSHWNTQINFIKGLGKEYPSEISWNNLERDQSYTSQGSTKGYPSQNWNNLERDQSYTSQGSTKGYPSQNWNNLERDQSYTSQGSTKGYPSPLPYDQSINRMSSLSGSENGYGARKEYDNNYDAWYDNGSDKRSRKNQLRYQRKDIHTNGDHLGQYNSDKNKVDNDDQSSYHDQWQKNSENKNCNGYRGNRKDPNAVFLEKEESSTVGQEKGQDRPNDKNEQKTKTTEKNEKGMAMQPIPKQVNKTSNGPIGVPIDTVTQNQKEKEKKDNAPTKKNNTTPAQKQNEKEEKEKKDDEPTKKNNTAPLQKQNEKEKKNSTENTAPAQKQKGKINEKIDTTLRKVLAKNGADIADCLHVNPK